MRLKHARYLNWCSWSIRSAQWRGLSCTEGSKAVSGEISDRERPQCCYFTAFWAEVFAIALAVEHLTRHMGLNPDEEAIIFSGSQAAIIFSGSQAAIKAVCCTTLKIEGVEECVAALEILLTLTSIKMHWKKAHIDTIRNETMDWLAKQEAAVLLMALPLQCQTSRGSSQHGWHTTDTNILSS